MPTQAQTQTEIPRQRMKPRGKPFTSDAARAAIAKRWAPGEQARIQRHIDQLVAAAPPLTDAQKAQLRALLNPADAKAGR